MFYKVGQSLLQTGERITKCGNIITKWGKHNYKVAPLRIITKGQDIFYRAAVIPLQSGAIIIPQRGMYYKRVRFITKWDRYYKLGQELLQSGAGNLSESGSIVIVKGDNYYRKG